MFIGIRTIDTTHAWLGTQDCATTGAWIENNSGVGRHLFFFGKAAIWTGNYSIELNHSLFSFHDSNFVSGQPIQDIHPPINLLIHADDLALQVADSIQIVLAPHGLTLFLQCQHLLHQLNDLIMRGLFGGVRKVYAAASAS